MTRIIIMAKRIIPSRAWQGLNFVTGATIFLIINLANCNVVVDMVRPLRILGSGCGIRNLECFA